MEKNWLIGFIEGEGCFSFQIHKNTDNAKYRGIYIAPIFTITLANAYSNYMCLKDIKRYLNYHNIEPRIYGRNEENKITSKNLALFIQKTKSIDLFIKLLENVKWYTNKKKSYELFSSVVNMLKKYRKAKKVCYDQEFLNSFLKIRSEINKSMTGRKESDGYIKNTEYLFQLVKK